MYHEGQEKRVDKDPFERQDTYRMAKRIVCRLL